MVAGAVIALDLGGREHPLVNWQVVIYVHSIQRIRWIILLVGALSLKVILKFFFYLGRFLSLGAHALFGLDLGAFEAGEQGPEEFVQF